MSQTAVVKFNQFFPHKRCINLDHRQDRWQHMLKAFRHHGIDSVRRFSALDGSKLDIPANWNSTAGAYGCLLSHVEIVREALEQGWSNVLILEDDVEFDPQLIARFEQQIDQLPEDWDMLYLGAFHIDDPTPVVGQLSRLNRSYCTFAYALNRGIFESFIASSLATTEPVDVNNLSFQQTANCYCFMPHLAWMGEFYSDVQERMANHWYIKESLTVQGAQVNQLLAQSAMIIHYHNPKQHNCELEKLLFLVQHYHHYLPGIEIVVVERAAQARLNQKMLPEHCRLLLYPDNGRAGRGACFNRAVQQLSAQRHYLVFMDSDVFIERFDIRGNIAMCRNHHGASGFAQSALLTEEDTRRIQFDDTLSLRWLQAQDYGWDSKASNFDRCCFLQRTCFEQAGGWDEHQLERLVLVQARSLDIFQSPNSAFILCQYDGTG